MKLILHTMFRDMKCSERIDDRGVSGFGLVTVVEQERGAAGPPGVLYSFEVRIVHRSKVWTRGHSPHRSHPRR
jgi:hypothetical protein